jgi:hypothetical protein
MESLGKRGRRDIQMFRQYAGSLEML